MNESKIYSCCFFGEISGELSDEVLDKLYFFINDLVIKGYKKFIFGTKTNFDFICLAIVNELKTIYNDICIVAYVRSWEGYNLTKYKSIIAKIKKCDLDLVCTVDSEVSIKTDFTESSYFERNIAIIDSSDLCVFYFDNKNDLFHIFKKEYDYVYRSNKNIINIL